VKKLRLNLINKLFIFFLTLGLAGVLFTALFSFHYTRKAILNRAFNQLTSVRELKKRQIENFFADRIRDITLLSEISTLNSTLNENFKDIKKLNDINRFLKISKYFETCYISDFNTDIIINTDSVFNDLKIFKDAHILMPTFGKIKEKIKKNQKIFIDDFQTDNEGNHHNKLYLAAPIFVSETLKGVLVLDIHSDALNDIMLVKDGRSGLGESGESYLVGEDLFMRTSSRLKGDAFLNINVNTVASQKASKHEEGTEIITDYRDVKVLSSFSYLTLPYLKWTILAEIDFNEVMIDIVKARNRIIIVALILCLLILPVSYLLAGKITYPIIKLNYAVNQVGDGSFETNLKAESNDEIGSLTESFNLMTEKLKQQSKDVKEREEHLQHFYDATKDAIILHNNLTPVLLNQSACSITGYAEEELKRMKLDGFLILKSESNNQSPFKSIIYETKLVRKDQSLINVEVQENTIAFKGNFIKAIVIRDITRRKRAEKALIEEREKRMSSLIDGQEIERQRLARELHDSLGQHFIAIKLKLERLNGADSAKSNDIIEDVKKHVDNIIDEARRISNNLMPAVLYEFGIQTALSNLCNRVQETAPFEIDFYSNLTSDSYGKKIKTYIYRIAQEALNNCLKHSEATLVKVFLLESSANITLIIKDNGKGFVFDENKMNMGKGLNNMKERSQLIDATCEIKTELTLGTEIKIEIPVMSENTF